MRSTAVFFQQPGDEFLNTMQRHAHSVTAVWDLSSVESTWTHGEQVQFQCSTNIWFFANNSLAVGTMDLAR